mmetsp:Transcript_30856/g.69447  ORF Transcript_30856/g.69447 Transcript_30856/m.69447 type:complete len:223 (+) Transcript_30856:182-850(+)
MRGDVGTAATATAAAAPTAAAALSRRCRSLPGGLLARGPGRRRRRPEVRIEDAAAPSGIQLQGLPHSRRFVLKGDIGKQGAENLLVRPVNGAKVVVPEKDADLALLHRRPQLLEALWRGLCPRLLQPLLQPPALRKRVVLAGIWRPPRQLEVASQFSADDELLRQRVPAGSHRRNIRLHPNVVELDAEEVEEAQLRRVLEVLASTEAAIEEQAVEKLWEPAH